MPSLNALLDEIRACEICNDVLPLGPRPVLVARASARLLVVGQAPGRKVHESGVPWSDPSGKRLRDWMGIGAEQFYDSRQVAIVPMGFCYPGTGKSGDLPPRPECAEHWHARVFAMLPRIETTLVIGQYSQRYILRECAQRSLRETVAAWREFAPRFWPLPHPSFRNNRWLQQNPWFEHEVLPSLREHLRRLLS